MLGRVVLGGGVLRAGQRAARLHQVEDVVAALDDLRRVGTTRLKLVHSSPSATVVRQTSVGVAHQVELRRRLRDGGEDRVLGEGQVGERLAEVALAPRPSRRSSGCRRSSG